METAIAVFTSRDRADHAVKELRDFGIQEEQIVFLTRSETEAKSVAKNFVPLIGGLVGAGAGFSAGAVVATLLLPGVGAVFALGVGGAALLGVAGAGASLEYAPTAERPRPTAIKTEEKEAQEAKFFREVLQQGRSLIVVRTDSPRQAATACGILDRFGIAMHGKIPLEMDAITRESGDVGIVDLRGRITVGEGSVRLRGAIGELMEKGRSKLLINLSEVNYIDSSGLGELVRTLTTVRGRGGHLKLAALNKRVSDLMHVTRLDTIFDIAADERSALASYAGKTAVA